MYLNKYIVKSTGNFATMSVIFGDINMSLGHVGFITIFKSTNQKKIKYISKT